MLKPEILKDRSRLNRAVRQFFENRDFWEVETPLFTPSPIPEAPIELFHTRRREPGKNTRPLFLIPSPEVWMKELLAQGAPSLFQICRCFRNGEQMGPWHRPEFTMLEWYALGEEGKDNIPRMAELLEAAGEALPPGKQPRALRPPFREITMEEAFRNHAGFSLEEDLKQGAEDLHLREILGQRLAERNLRAPREEAAEDLFHRLFLNLVEPELPQDQPLILKDWPALVPTLARRLPGSPWVDRWELYLKGVEIANGYGEERDEEALKSYWAGETKKKSTPGHPFPADPLWPERVARGMPPCAGTALGMDRFLALLRGEADLAGLELFPIRAMLGE